MTLLTFSNAWHLIPSPVVQQLYSEAYARMKRSKDPAHDEKHIEALLSNAHIILKGEGALQKCIDLEILILSIAWHDVWRASFVPRNVLELLYSFWWDGMGSENAFKQYAKTTSLSPEMIKKVGYAIRKHHSVQFLPRTTVEAKVLKDCDELEIWSIKRAETMYEYALEYLTALGMKRAMKRYIHLKIHRSVKTVYFKTTATLLEQKMKVFLREFDEEIASF